MKLCMCGCGQRVKNKFIHGHNSRGKNHPNWRNGKIKDPFGHCWSFATYKWVYTEEEMKKNQEEWVKSVQG